MIREINIAMAEACSDFDLSMMKVKAVSEAASRELAINYQRAELKVLTESGTDADMAYLCTEAKHEFAETIVTAIEHIKEAILKFFSDMKDRVVNVIVSVKNKEIMDKVKQKVKLMPLLGRKKVVVENYDAQEKCGSKFLAQLQKLKAKFAAGQEVSSEDVSKVMSDYEAEHSKLAGVRGSITTSLQSAIGMFEKLRDKAMDVTKANQKAASDAIESLKQAAKKVDVPGTAENLARGFATVCQNLQRDFMSVLTGLLTKIRDTVKGVKQTQEEIKEASEEDPWDQLMNGGDELAAGATDEPCDGPECGGEPTDDESAGGDEGDPIDDLTGGSDDEDEPTLESMLDKLDKLF